MCIRDRPIGEPEQPKQPEKTTQTGMADFQEWLKNMMEATNKNIESLKEDSQKNNESLKEDIKKNNELLNQKLDDNNGPWYPVQRMEMERHTAGTWSKNL